VLFSCLALGATAMGLPLPAHPWAKPVRSAVGGPWAKPRMGNGAAHQEWHSYGKSPMGETRQAPWCPVYSFEARGWRMRAVAATGAARAAAVSGRAARSVRRSLCRRSGRAPTRCASPSAGCTPAAALPADDSAAARRPGAAPSDRPAHRARSPGRRCGCSGCGARTTMMRRPAPFSSPSWVAIWSSRSRFASASSAGRSTSTV